MFLHLSPCLSPCLGTQRPMILRMSPTCLSACLLVASSWPDDFPLVLVAHLSPSLSPFMLHLSPLVSAYSGYTWPGVFTLAFTCFFACLPAKNSWPNDFHLSSTCVPACLPPRCTCLPACLSSFHTCLALVSTYSGYTWPDVYTLDSHLPRPTLDNYT